jgi:hypothetical protein
MQFLLTIVMFLSFLILKGLKQATSKG